MTQPRVGVLLVGGFLGAGKTTLVSRLLRDPDVGPRLAVLVNELGALGLDGELIRSSSESAALRTVQLDSGCLCCTLKGSLGEALLELARPTSGEPPAQIVVELSGAALASEVHFQVATQALDAPFYADGLVCVVDAAQASRWAREEPDLFSDQLRHADLVLLSKIDRATAEQRAATEALIVATNPRAIVIPAAFGDIDPTRLLGAGVTTVARPAHAHGHALLGHTIALDGVVKRVRLEAFLDDSSPELYRIKGRVMLDDGPALVQCVGDQIEVTSAEPTASLRLTFIGRPADVLRWAHPNLVSERLGVGAALVAGG